MKQEIINRIIELEKQFPTNNFNEEEYINNLIETLEYILQYEIRNRVVFEKIDYRDIDRSIFKFLTKEELRYIIDSEGLLKNLNQN